MSYTARFSKLFLKKENQLPIEVKSRIFEAIKEILIKPNNGTMLVGQLKVHGKCELEKYRIIYETDEQRSELFFTPLNSEKKYTNKSLIF